MAVDSLDFRRTMSRFATGITVVTTTLDGNLYGITVNSFTSVSLNPPLVLICIDQNTDSYSILPQSGVYCVNILTEKQQFLSDRFAGRGQDAAKPFHDLEWTTEATGSPVLANTLGYADCRIVKTYEGGDHLIFLGEVEKLAWFEPQDEDGRPLGPLLYYQSNYRFMGQ